MGIGACDAAEVGECPEGSQGAEPHVGGGGWAQHDEGSEMDVSGEDGKYASGSHGAKGGEVKILAGKVLEALPDGFAGEGAEGSHGWGAVVWIEEPVGGAQDIADGFRDGGGALEVDPVERVQGGEFTEGVADEVAEVA